MLTGVADAELELGVEVRVSLTGSSAEEPLVTADDAVDLCSAL